MVFDLQLLDLVVNKVMGKERMPAGQTKKQKVFSIIGLCVALLIFGGYPLFNWYNTTHPVSRECTIESAEVSSSRSGTGGIATSSTKLKIHTSDCGTVYISSVADPGYRASWQEMADEVNKYQGQKMTLLFKPIQLPAEGDRVEGLGLVL